MKALVLCFALLAATVCHAQSWPQKPVRVIVPFAPGGASDLMPRLVGEKLASMWGQPVLIENRPGAAGNIGMEAGARSAPDGYALLAAPNGNLVVNPHMYSRLAYDVFKDLAPVTRIAAVQNVLVVHPDVPAKTVKELVTLAREKPGGANARIAFCLEKIRRTRKTPLDGARVIVHRVAIKACLSQNFLALLPVAVQIMRRAFGQSHIQVRVRFDRVIDNPGPGILIRPRPNGETKPPARLQNTARFRASLFGI